ncbi:filamentous hemagglutinin N-terminal domain-containing protein [Variovorax sp.]|uniref:two-partner secretion domain-containing protein n=1 Tax=Variovorax sp. TaxID=1871043 RepID=UPI003BAA7535
MNRHLHRVVFNAARGMRMVVQETAASTGKGASRATTAAGAAALAGALIAGAAHGQIVGAPNVPGNLRPTVLTAPNGVPLVNIQTPSAAGVSRNVYNQFSVGANGAILNNSRVNVQTQLGGFVQGNPNLATGPARIILNEVNGGTPSQLRGYIEVGGQRAEVIIANPAGISVDGGGFINASRATLTTGTPQFNAVGGLDSFLVRGGTVTIDGAGLDASKTDYAAILARAVQANASIWASELKVVTGANQISADHSQITPTTGTGTAPTFALDVAALGGMYANKIVLIGSEAGLGVRNAGSIGAGAGGLVVTAAGRLENIGTLEGRRVELTTAGDISNRGGTIRQGSSAGLTIASPVLSNTSGGVIGAEPVSAGASSGGTSSGGSTGGGTTSPTGGGGMTTPSTTGGSDTGSSGTSTPATYTPPAPGVITAGGIISNDGGKIYAGGPITLNTPQVNNAGGSLNVATMAVAGPSFSNAGGTLNVSNSFSANVGQLDNTGGKLNAGSLNIATSGDLINTDGTLTSATDASLTVGGKVENTRGSISAAGALTANVAGATVNNSGTLASNQALTLKTDSLQNTQGSIQSAQAGVQLGVTNALTNGSGGSINAATDVSVQAGSLANGGSLRGGNDATVAVGGALTNDGSITAWRNTTISAGSVQSSSSSVLGAGIQNDGKLGSVGNLRVTASGALVANGTNLAAGNATLQGQSVDLSASQTSAANIAITATQGDVITSKATVVTPGTLSITANAQPGQTLTNDAGKLNAGLLQIDVSNLANTNAGEIVQTGAGVSTITASGILNNDGSRIASNGQDLSLRAASISSANGKIEHAGAGTLTVAGGSYNGANGQITTNGALAVAMSSAFNQDGDQATTSAKQQITIDAGSLSNRGGRIIQTGTDATRITVSDALDNSNAGTIASNGNTTISAGSLMNQGSTIRAAETSSLGLSVGGSLDNSNKGVIGAGGNTTVAAGSINNNTGSVTAVGDLKATIRGAAMNAGGTLAANGNTRLVADTLDNRSGAVAAVNGDLSVTTTGATTNDAGTLQAGGKTALSSGGLSNVGGKAFGDSLSVDTHGNALNNSVGGTLAATTMVAINSGALTNDASLIQSGGVMTINTNGQALINTTAASYTTKQGGIASGDTLDLKAGTVNNAAGFIGSKNALTAETQAFSNTDGGLVLSQSTVAINTNGTAYDNSGGQTQAVGDLSINAGSINNNGGLVRSIAKTALNAGTIANTNTLGTDQGIEGKNVAIGVGGDLNNASGAIRADVNATITSGGTLTNTNGLISAGNTLGIVDPNRANPAAKTLNVVNTGGTLVAGTAAVLGADGKVQTAAFGKLDIDARSFSGDGMTVGVNDLSIVLAQDVTNNVDVKAGGNLAYATTGKLTNSGKLLAGGTVTASGNDVENTVNGEMTGGTTIVSAASTLTNRGLIDGYRTQINGGTVNNVGTGRIYGDIVSVAAGTLNNDSETIGGVTRAGTIASRDTLDIGAQTINNREHALLFSVGEMFIGGGLDAKRQAIGKGGALNNLSATVESLSDMSIAMGQINNFDNHFTVIRTSSGPVNGDHTITPLGGIEMPIDKFVLDRGGRVWSTIINGQVVSGKGWIERQYTTTTEVDQPANPPDPGRIYSGGNMIIDGKLRNRDSQVMAGGQFSIDPANIDNTPTQGQRVVTVGGLQIFAPPEKGNNVVPGFIPEQKSIYTIDVGTSCINTCTDVAHSGKKVDAAQGVAVIDQAGAAGAVTAGTRARAIVEVPSAVGGFIKTSGNTADSAATAGGTSGAGRTSVIPLVVRTSLPNTTIPTTSLFGIHAGPGGYLIETDPRFANYRNWLSSDYLLKNLGLDPNNILKRLGDGFYEQKLIREQVAQLTGYRYLANYSNDEDQYIALMTAGAIFAEEYGLRPGIALTPAQMAQLTSDIVWLVEQTVTLPDGTTQQVLVPQVYVRVQPGDITGGGSLLSAERMIIKGKGDLTNSGTIAGRTLVEINADNINNLGGRIAGGSVKLDAKNDINNIGGSITGANSVSLKAGHDIKIETTTNSQVGWLASKTNIDRVAGVYVTNPGGTLIASAGNDVNVIGGILSNKGKDSFTGVTAGKNINLGTVTESSSRLSIFTPTTYHGDASSKEIGSTIVGDGTVLLNAKGGDINARAATLDSGKGLLSLTAAGDINITSGVETSATMGASQSTKKGFLKSTTSSVSGESQSTTSIGSHLSGQAIGLSAGRDINVVGSDIEAQGNASLTAGRNVNIVSAVDSVSASLDRSRETKGFIVPKLGGSSIDRAIRNEQHAEVSSQFERASNVTAGGNLGVTAGQQVNVYASNLSAGEDLKITGKEVTILSGTNEVRQEIGSKDSKKSIGTMGNFKRVGKGMNGKESVTNALNQTTLAAATLNGKNVTISATDGNLTLGAVRIKADDAVALNAPKGAVNFDVVKTGTEVGQSRGESDPMYQRTRDTGLHLESANYTQIDSKTLKLDTPKVNVQVGQNSTKGPGDIYVAQQTIEQVLQGQRNQPGMGWLNQIQSDPALNKVQINWEGVPLEQRRWAEKQGSLTQAGGAVVAIVATVMTWGAASSIGTVAGSAVGGGTTGSIVGAAVSAGVSSIAAQAAVGLINHNGNIGEVLEDLASSQGIKNITTAMLTAGTVQGLNISLGLGGAASTLTTPQLIGRGLIDGAAAGLIRSAINGTSLETELANGMLNGLLNSAAAGSANWIGGNTEGFVNELAHALAGCLAGAGSAAVNGGTSAGTGCSAGAVGAVVGHLAGEYFNPTGDPALSVQSIALGQMVGALAGLLVGGDAASVNIASNAGGNAVENNLLSGAQRRQRDAELSACAKDANPTICEFKVSERWSMVDYKQQVVYDTLSAAKERALLNPTAANVIALNNAITDMVSLYGEFQTAGDTRGARTISAALVSGVLSRAQSCAALQGGGGCGTIVLTPTERSAVANAFIEFGLASEGSIAASDLRTIRAIGEVIGSGSATAWRTLTELFEGLSASARQLTRQTVRPEGSAVNLGTKLGTDQDTIKAAQWLKPEPGYYDVVIHGNADTAMVLRNGVWVNVDQRALATYIGKQADYSGGPVRLASCSTGSCSTGYAQDLANKLGVPVMAPTDLLFVYPNGAVVIGPNAYSNTGSWQVFRPTPN